MISAGQQRGRTRCKERIVSFNQNDRIGNRSRDSSKCEGGSLLVDVVKSDLVVVRVVVLSNNLAEANSMSCRFKERRLNFLDFSHFKKIRDSFVFSLISLFERSIGRKEDMNYTTHGPEANQWKNIYCACSQTNE